MQNNSQAKHSASCPAKYIASCARRALEVLSDDGPAALQPVCMCGPFPHVQMARWGSRMTHAQLRHPSFPKHKQKLLSKCPHVLHACRWHSHAQEEELIIIWCTSFLCTLASHPLSSHHPMTAWHTIKLLGCGVQAMTLAEPLRSQRPHIQT